MSWLEYMYRTRQLFRVKDLEAARTPKHFGDLASQREKCILMYIKSHGGKKGLGESEIIEYFKSPQNFTFYNNAFTKTSIQSAVNDLSYYDFIEVYNGRYRITKVGLKFLRDHT